MQRLLLAWRGRLELLLRRDRLPAAHRRDPRLPPAAGPEGEQLQAAAAAATAALQPAHTGVPWVVAAGQSLGGNTPTLAATGLFACAAADAAARPAACGQLALDANAEA